MESFEKEPGKIFPWEARPRKDEFYASLGESPPMITMGKMRGTFEVLSGDHNAEQSAIDSLVSELWQ